MWCKRTILVLGYILQTQSAFALWSCTQDLDCGSLVGAVCNDGTCTCPLGQQSVFGGTLCVDLAPYHTSQCVEDHQCSRLLTSFECRVDNDNDAVGICFCQEGFHYFLGRCWRSIDYGEPCNRDEQCLGVLRDPYNLKCNVTCSCADGFYQRQRGECRRIAEAVGDSCVLDEDCQFPGGVCDSTNLVCYIENAASNTSLVSQTSIPNPSVTSVSRQLGVACNMSSFCDEPYECSPFGVCICPIGYYSNNAGTLCLAELGSPATSSEQCVGLLATIWNGICTCPANFYFDENMRDCIRVTRRITESCVTDSNCHTFGSAARCGPPQPPWGLRNCECAPEDSIWDANRNICRLFAGVGESCEVDSDCLAGELEIQCVQNDLGEGVCTCPDGYIESDGLCLTTGLELGDPCQATAECTETPNTICENGRCSCDSSGYQEIDGHCAPIIGGACTYDEDCTIVNTVCVTVNNTNVPTCQCSEEFIEYADECWPSVPGINASCEVNAQCEHVLGATSICNDGYCNCIDRHHYRDEGCWPITELFESCRHTSQCYLGAYSERVLCRNSLCQCDFNYPYSELLHTCTGGAASHIGSISVIATALLYLFVS